MGSFTVQGEPIAVIGVGCRFPGGAKSPSKLWDLITEKRDVLREIPPSRFDTRGVYHPNGDRPGCTNSKAAYLMDEDIRMFDSSFFNINPREAEAVDPQHRILLETVYEAMEAGALTIEGMKRSDTSVYIGLMTGDYHEAQLRDPGDMPKYMATGTARSIISNRVSYFFDWKGPSMTIDTACSSSLVAVHHAVQSLRSGESKMAVAGGSNLILGPELMISESKLKMLSPTGRSRMWDADADGYARGEGVAVVILKTLSQALADGDDIKCLIRETGVNQDGRTQGITLPSSEAQTALMRQTYRKAGLDITNPSDRCQFFEAHGTGTPAGDPIEARAIRDAFFPVSSTGLANSEEDEKLFVGSVKTTIGHLEGCAGLAGLIKASEAVRRGIIPPNMHFNRLNPKILPLYQNMRVPSECQPWPVLDPHQPRRASVNSFGFGGTNAHAIVESYEPERPSPIPSSLSSPLLMEPLIFSANSETSLRSMVEAYRAAIMNSGPLSLSDLAWTLRTRRSEHPIKAFFSGISKDAILASMESWLENPSASLGVRPPLYSDKPRLLGVFTGQGAQWAGMGLQLLQSSQAARECVLRLEASLAQLPDRPSWSLMQEMSNTGKDSRLSEAEIAQPLCTAVQVMLVDLLYSVGVTLDVVVGHSSGEIGAAYAAGVISAAEAIRIAYYRGVHTKLAQGPDGSPGAMLAVGLSFDEAQKFCETPSLNGRVEVAASNAPGSVTLSGDLDAINAAKALLDEDKVFARLLKVDKAYHSRHMIPCSEAYLQSLRACLIDPKAPRRGCDWVSSVTGELFDEYSDLELFAGPYWVDNMLKPVLLYTAVEEALNSDPRFDLALEIGPHPALKGPVTQTIKYFAQASVPYNGTLTRGVHDVEALSNTFGFLMTNLGVPALKLDEYLRASTPDFSLYVVTPLPSYPWDHRQSFWRESRRSRFYRQRAKPRHDLLGSRSPDDVDQTMIWHNVIRMEETPWLTGHKVQGQMIFPAAGYLVMALEAARELFADREVAYVELLEVELSRAISFKDDSSEVEVLFTLKQVNDGSTSDEGKMLMAEFACFSAADKLSSWDLNVRGHLQVRFKDELSSSRSKRIDPALVLSSVDTDCFYTSLASIGLDYTGLFRRLKSIERKMHRAVASAIEYSDDLELPAMIHPALLDASFQTLFAAFCWPDDGSLQTPFVPTEIKRLRVNYRTTEESPSGRPVTIDSFITSATAQKICGDVEIYDGQSAEMIVQVEGLNCTMLGRPSAADDRELFASTVWDMDIGSGISSAAAEIEDKAEDLQLVDLCERLSYFYLRELNSTVVRNERSGMIWHHQSIFDFIDYLFPIIESGQHPTIRAAWTNDTPEWLESQVTKYRDQIDLQLIRAVGKNLAAVVRGQTTMLEHMIEDDMLNRFYKNGLGFQRANGSLSRMTAQIAHRYPRMKILEIGAGTGGATKGVLEALGTTTFQSYTFTDISTGFFESAQEAFRPWATRMKMKALNIEEDVVDQGFEEGAYDLIIASNVLHATKDLKHTMQNVRRLLKPGGYLQLLEVTSDILRVKLMMSGLSGWWLGKDDNRRYGPTITAQQWNSLLKETGFSGVDHIVHDFEDASKHMTSVMISQAVDESVAVLRDPLALTHLPVELHSALIIGGKSSRTSQLACHIANTIGRFTPNAYAATVVDDFESLAKDTKLRYTSVICLQDLDQPVLRSLTENKLNGIKQLFQSARQVLWVTAGCRLQNPEANMSVGMGRALQAEYPHVQLQLLDLSPEEIAGAGNLIAGAAIRLFASDALASISKNLLWTTEPELASEYGRLLIPRILPDTELNDRLNSGRRVVTKKVLSSISPVNILWVNGSYSLQEPGFSIEAPKSDDEVVVRVTHSMLSAIRFAQDTYQYLCLGTVTPSDNGSRILPKGAQVLALSDVNGSIVRVPISKIVPASVAQGMEQQYIRSIAFNLLAMGLLSEVPSGGTIVICEPDASLAAVVKSQGVQSGIKTLSFTSSKLPETVDAVQVDSTITERRIKEILPSEVDLVLDFSEGSGDQGIRAMAQTLRGSCPLINVHDLFSRQSKTRRAFSPTSVQADLLKAQLHAQALNLTPADSDSHSLLLADIAASRGFDHYASIVVFPDHELTSVAVAPINTRGLFRADRTYLMVGCTGGLGKSLCTWMIRNGARHLALTTRNVQKVESKWLDELKSLGGKVTLFKVDIADETAFKAAHDEIRRTMPPIAGVANAAMVLSDRLFEDLTVRDFEQVLRPKVEGTRILDEAFSDATLDFFILFSSLASIVGNRGQSNYLAANMYMTTVAARRKNRGLAGSVMHIGMILGIGYVSETEVYEASLRKFNYMPIPEPHFHIIFAEAILAGLPGTRHPADLITGLNRHSTRQDAQNPFWHNNARFCHHTLNEQAVDEVKVRTDVMPLKQRLAGLSTTHNRAKMIQDDFVMKLERVLQVVKENIGTSQSLMNLGVDSLMAVEIRFWFLKELDIDMPVLKVLGGSSIADLCQDAAADFSVAVPLAAEGAPDRVVS